MGISIIYVREVFIFNIFIRFSLIRYGERRIGTFVFPYSHYSVWRSYSQRVERGMALDSFSQVLSGTNISGYLEFMFVFMSI